jgi:hypothetical protein
MSWASGASMLQGISRFAARYRWRLPARSKVEVPLDGDETKSEDYQMVGQQERCSGPNDRFKLR